jgi:hypothetical protein
MEKGGKKKKKVIALCIDPDILKKLDEIRGLTKRSTFVEYLVLKEVAKGDKK